VGVLGPRSVVRGRVKRHRNVFFMFDGAKGGSKFSRRSPLESFLLDHCVAVRTQLVRAV
jgi:hypothetical protein